jgi:D-lactate dehydrogenase (cytochrome)
LNQLIEIASSDLYVTAGAGMKFAELQGLLGQEGSWLPAASPWPDATLGGVLSTNLNAPLRMRYGCLRDQVLAITFVLGDGRVVRAGRPVVKNVAGYDLARLLVGAYGTLGLIAEITFKFTALPRRRTSLVFPAAEEEQGLLWGLSCLAHARVASAVLLASDIQADGEAAKYRLVYTAEGQPEDVYAELNIISTVLERQGAPEPEELEDFSGTDIWKTFLGSTAENRLLLHSGVAPKQMKSLLETHRPFLGKASTIIDVANGHAFAAFTHQDGGRAGDAIQNLRKAAMDLGGYLTVLHMPQILAGRVDPWGYQPETLAQMKKLKELWDPSGILNRGVFLV